MHSNIHCWLSGHSKYEIPLSVFTLSFSFPYPLYSGLSYFIDTLRTLAYLSTQCFLSFLFDHYHFLLLSSEENTIYLQFVWTYLNGRCEEIEGKSLTLVSLNGLRTSEEPLFFFFKPIDLQDESYLHYPEYLLFFFSIFFIT